MRLGWIELRDVRSHGSLAFHPESGVNVLVGENGAGKTTVLESLGYLATLRSFRGSPDRSLITDGADSAVVRGGFERSGAGELVIEVEIPTSGRRRALVNGKTLAKRSELIGEVALVSFLPDDLDVIKRGPVYRRDAVDDVAARLRPTAADDQDLYARALRQRNALLRRDGVRADPVTLDVWDERLVLAGTAVIMRRLETLSTLGPRLADVFEQIGDHQGVITWRYEAAGLGVVLDPSLVAENLAAAVGAARRADMERRTSTVGPHRDEVVIEIDGRDARTRASQGEQRSLAIGLRVAAFELLRDRAGTEPILLLDDVFSELDAPRSDRLVERLPAGQIFITTARIEDVPVTGAQWRVRSGAIVPLET